MEIPVLAKTKELDNQHHIYLFYLGDRWYAFGYSAYYLSIMYPKLDVFSKSFFLDDGDYLPFFPVPETCLLDLSDNFNTLVSDAYIQVCAPPAVYSQRYGYDEWYGKLINCEQN